jgi:hypothetical protein
LIIGFSTSWKKTRPKICPDVKILEDMISILAASVLSEDEVSSQILK